MSGTNEGSKSNGGLADDLIREASEHAVARSNWMRRRQELGIEKSAAPESAPIQNLAEAPAATPATPVPPPPPPPPAAMEVRAAEVATPAHIATPVAEPPPPPAPPRVLPARDAALAVFCFEAPEGAVGQYVSQALPAILTRGTPVHLFTRNGYFAALTQKGVKVHDVGNIEVTGAAHLLQAVEDFSKLAHHTFEDVFGERHGDIVLLAHEWPGIHAAMALSAAYGLRTLFSIHSLECQRSDMSSALSKDIQEIERLGLRQSDAVLVHNAGADPLARQLAPESAPRIRAAVQPFPLDEFQNSLDAGAIKARFQVGPVDPLLLFVGNFDHRHGPDIMVKAAPAILKNFPQARFVLVGEGDLQWPMRVHARYLLLDYAIRFAGHLEGQPLRELIQAAQVICVPSRERTEDWPFFAAWAAGKPVLATHEAGGSLLQHDQNSLLCYPAENSFVWGAERLLENEGLRNRLADTGHQRLKQFCGWDRAAEQIQEAMGVLTA